MLPRPDGHVLVAAPGDAARYLNCSAAANVAYASEQAKRAAANNPGSTTARSQARPAAQKQAVARKAFQREELPSEDDSEGDRSNASRAQRTRTGPA